MSFLQVEVDRCSTVDDAASPTNGLPHSTSRNLVLHRRASPLASLGVEYQRTLLILTDTSPLFCYGTSPVTQGPGAEVRGFQNLQYAVDSQFPLTRTQMCIHGVKCQKISHLVIKFFAHLSLYSRPRGMQMILNIISESLSIEWRAYMMEHSSFPCVRPHM